MLSWRRSHRSLLIVLVFLAGALRGVAADPPARHEKQPLVGKQVDIELQSGKSLRGVQIEEAVAGKIPGTIARLRVVDLNTGSRPILGASAVKRVTAADGTPLLAFDEPTRCLASPDAATLATIHQAAATTKQASRQATSKPNEPKSPRPAKKNLKKPASPEDEAARHKRNEESRAEFYKKTGVWLWPELTADEQQQALTVQKDYVRKVSERFASLNMRLDETEHFLFLSDLPPQPASLYTSCLDTMYDQLCKAFAIKDRQRVWLGGKTPVVAFSRGEDLASFEQEFFKNRIDFRVTQGLAHQLPSGIVIIGCHCGKDPYYFASVLVHETTHGFLHRYKSSQVVPNWLNEGIAEWVAMNVVARDQGVKRKVRDAILRVHQTRSLGGDFFTTEHLAPNQYGIATAMVEYMLRANPKAFRAMIESIKLGEDWQSALKKSFRVTPEQLTQQFGMSIVRVPNLTP
ncbi:MAG: hypothetical protein ABFC96_18705 [Thermoguttaceae bacterium]